MAQSGHPELHCTCLLLGVKRTWAGALQMSAYDPKLTSGLRGLMSSFGGEAGLGVLGLLGWSGRTRR